MPRNIKLPNGVVMTDIPDNISRGGIATKAIQLGIARPSDFGYEEASGASESGMENFLAGAGSGLVNVGRQAVNMVLPDQLTPDWASDEAIAQQREIDQDLLETGAGKGGRVVGEIAATLPVGGVGGAVAKGAGAIRGASRGANYLKHTLARGAGRGAVEGATAGAILAGPDERMSGAYGGALLGGALGGAGTALGKALGKGSVVKQTDEAIELEKLTGHFIPLSQSAKPGMVKQIYNAFLANLPGVGGKIRGQYKDALNDFRRYVIEESVPDNPRAWNIIGDISDDPVDVMLEKVGKYWETAFDDIKPWPIIVRASDKIAMPNSLAKLLKGQLQDKLIKPIAPGVKLKGEDILNMKTAISEVFDQLPASAKKGAKAYLKKLDDLLDSNLNPTGKGKGKAAKDLQAYRDAQEFWPKWTAVKRAAKSAKDNMSFSPAQMGNQFKEVARSGKGNMQRASELGVEALENFPSRQGLFQTLAAAGPIAGTGAAVGGLAGSATALATAIAVGRLAASKGLQKYLAGTTKFQNVSRQQMERFSRELQNMGMTARDAAIVLGIGDQDAS